MEDPRSTLRYSISQCCRVNPTAGLRLLLQRLGGFARQDRVEEVLHIAYRQVEAYLSACGQTSDIKSIDQLQFLASTVYTYWGCETLPIYAFPTHTDTSIY